METLHQSYREMLKQEFADRCSRNASYSLRAFSRDIGILNNHLSEVFAGKKGLSKESASKIAAKIGWTNAESSYFNHLVVAEHGRSAEERRVAKQSILALEPPKTNSNFELISRWYHLALLELIHLSPNVGFNELAKRLGVTKEELKIAVNKLVELGVLEYDGSKFSVLEVRTQTESQVPSKMIKNFHDQLLSKARDALYNDPMDEREFSTTVLSIDKSDLPKARQLIKEFWRDLAKSMNKSKNKNEVYALGVQFFKLTEENK